MAISKIIPNSLDTGGPTWNSNGELALGSFTQSNNDPATIKGIEMGAPGNLVYGTGGSQSGLMTNLYYNGGWKVAQTGQAVTQYYQLIGGHFWGSSAYNTSAGSAGSSPTISQVMSIAAGNSLALQGASLQTGTGITFPATQNASSDPNTLDDYEEGSYTTAVTLGTGTITTANANTLTYTKIGRQVTVTGRLYLTLSTTNTNSFQFTIPFVCSNDQSKESASVCEVIRATTIAGVGYAGQRIFRAYLGASYFQMMNGDGAPTGDFGVSSPHIIVNITYFTD